MFTYSTITDSVEETIRGFLHDVQYCHDENAWLKIEKAYGAYMTWRALVFGKVPSVVFSRDDERIEKMLRNCRFGKNHKG